MENQKLIVSLGRGDVYRQLLALCNDGDEFSLVMFPDGYDEDKLECLTIADRKAITAEYPSTAKDKIIGFIRLLPHNSDTLIDFVHKNRSEWHDYPVINPDLWHGFIKAVFEYFGTNDSGQKPKDANKINININGNVNGNMIVGDENTIEY